MGTRPTTINEISCAVKTNMVHFGHMHMKLAASLAREIMVKAARQAADYTGVPAEDMIETIEADIGHALEQCEATLQWHADWAREGDPTGARR